VLDKNLFIIDYVNPFDSLLELVML